MTRFVVVALVWCVGLVFAVETVPAAAGASTAGGSFGLGIIAGEPTGISGKKWLSHRTAIDGAVAWSFGHEDAMHVHGDYLIHNRGAIAVDQGVMAVHFGIGGRLKFGDDVMIGVRVPIGLTYLLENAPLDTFIEIVPILDLAHKTDLNLNAAVGVRYFFGKRRY